jgi:hypothetical protein
MSLSALPDIPLSLRMPFVSQRWQRKRRRAHCDLVLLARRMRAIHSILRRGGYWREKVVDSRASLLRALRPRKGNINRFFELVMPDKHS